MENVKSMEHVFSMKGGSGDSSYVNNSTVQLNMIRAFKPLLEHSIYQNVRSIPGMMGADHNVFRIVPASIVDKNSAAWNGGHVYISSDAVGLAYLKQFRQDFISFVQARAHEMVPGGCMFITLLARSSSDIKEQGIMGGFAGQLEGALEELMKEGLIEDGKLNSIKLPIYCTNVEELQSIVEMEQSFEIESMRFLRFPSHPFTEVREGEEGMIAKILESYYKSMFESIVGSHFEWDERLVDVIFTRIESRVTGKSRYFLRNTDDVVFAFLVHKTY